MATIKNTSVEEAWESVEISAKNLTLAKMAKEKGMPEFNSTENIDAITCFRLIFAENIKNWVKICRELDKTSV